MPADALMIQELVPGDGRRQFAYGAFWKRDHAVATMVARRRRQHPPDFGRASTFTETIEHPQVERLSERFLRHLGYYGLVELEYKEDPHGTFKLLDVNARTWGYHTLAYAAGVDFPALLFADQVGKPTGTWRCRPGVRWIRLVTDLPTAAVEMRAGTLSPRAYLRSLRGLSIESVFSASDPVPGIAELFTVPYLMAQRGF
jgi:D-aspartate ligase